VTGPFAKSRKNRGQTTFRLLLAGVLSLAGCAHFEPRPLSPAESATQLETRSLTNAALRAYLEDNLHRQFTAWPPENWDFEMLCLAAWYYNPTLEVARAQWAVARGGETTAGQRPNPALTVTPGYNTTTTIPSPWIPQITLDVPIETAGKRRYRRAQATQLSEAARLSVASAAWQVRGAVRTSLLDYSAAGARERLLQAQLGFQQQLVDLLEQQVKAGARPGSDILQFRLALVKAQLDLADAHRVQVESRARLAEAIGVSFTALEGLAVAPDWERSGTDSSQLSSADAQRTALHSRTDVLSALAEYAASQSALQLEIAKQYPDVRLSPGYQYDQGDNKWSLGLSVDLPILNQNQGPIAEAKARRHQAAAKFELVQAKVLAEIERAVAGLQVAETNSSGLRALGAEQSRRRDAIAAQVQAGAAERLELVAAQFEYATTELFQLEGALRLQQARAALEDALQRPFELSPSIFNSSAHGF
jgi:cobalt-zinc-cadmium efflux system outer membrane protein